MVRGATSPSLNICQQHPLCKFVLIDFIGDAATQLNRFLLRTICTELFDIVLMYVAEDNGVPIPQECQFNGKARIFCCE